MGTESYRTAHVNSQGMDGIFQADIDLLNNELARLEERTKTYDVDVERYAALVSDLETKDNERVGLEKEKEDSDKELARIKNQKEELDGIEKLLQAAASEKNISIDRHGHAIIELKESEAAVAEMEASAEGHQA
jgi:hypothetical protein